MITSPYPDVEIPDSSLADYVLGGAAARGDRPALIDGATGWTLTYAELAERVGAVASGLAAEGVAPGDTVALLSPNCLDWPVAFLAASSLGAVVSTLNPVLTPAEVATLLEVGGADAAIVAARRVMRSPPSTASSGSTRSRRAPVRLRRRRSTRPPISPCCRSRPARRASSRA
jgi:acyl-CoA synthetase (AMP-forming)/AMP-acid ligase II